MNERVYRTLLLGSSLSLAACAGHEASDPDALDSFGMPITGGTRVTEAENASLPFSAAVHLDGDCSGVKINTRRFLTGIHCVPAQDTLVTISKTTDPARFPPPAFTVSKIFFHPSYHLLQNTTNVIQRGGYEAAVVDVVEDSPDIPIAQVNATIIHPGPNNLMLLGYGCDAIGTNDFFKQKGFFTSLDDEPIATHVHYLHENTTGVATCDGDSGGPLLSQVGGQWKISGIVAGTGYFTRISSILEWLTNPAANQFGDLQTGYFINGKISSEPGFNTFHCAAMDLPPVGQVNPIVDVRLGHCDHFSGVLTGKKPGWRLRADTIAGHFTIRNRSDSRCLHANTATGNAEVRDCVPGSLQQAWRFEDAGLAGPGATRGTTALHFYRLVADVNDRCLGTFNGLSSSGTDVRMFNCDTARQDQKWLFTR